MASATETGAGAHLDRAADARRRDLAWLAAQREHPAARALPVSSDGFRLRGERLAPVPLGEVPAGSAPLLLGLDAEGPLFAVDVDPSAPDGERPPLIAGGSRRGQAVAPPPAAEGTRTVALREAAAVLSDHEGGLAAYAAALLNWHRRDRCCSVCGTGTEVREGGLLRRCPRCQTTHHPRTDPVVIMLVTDGDRLLLGRQAAWPVRRYSALAGFVEPGETLEAAVVREVREEAGVTVGPPCYVASQAWPFPASLMLGFDAPWRAGEAAPGEDEIEDVRWFSRAEVAAAAELDVDGWGVEPAGAPGDGLLLPPRTAIARRLVEGWLGA